MSSWGCPRCMTVWAVVAVVSTVFLFLHIWLGQRRA